MNARCTSRVSHVSFGIRNDSTTSYNTCYQGTANWLCFPSDQFNVTRSTSRILFTQMRHITKTRTWHDADSKTYFYLDHTSHYMPSVNWKEVLHSSACSYTPKTVARSRVNKNSREFSISVTSTLQWWDYVKLEFFTVHTANLYDIYHCCVYSEKLLMMDRGTVRNM